MHEQHAWMQSHHGIQASYSQRKSPLLAPNELGFGVSCFLALHSGQLEETCMTCHTIRKWTSQEALGLMFRAA